MSRETSERIVSLNTNTREKTSSYSSLIYVRFFLDRILRVIAEDPDADPYLILGVDKAAAPGEIKKRYWKLSLRVHPDKNPDDKRAVDAFQALRGAAEGLMDAEKRKQVRRGHEGPR